jgi:hypothetical protein
MTEIKYPKDECYTPQWLFDKLGVQFDLDVASSYHPLVIVPTKDRYTIKDNALVKPWYGNVWMNPPFSKVTPWIDKWLDHRQGICLVPLSSNGRWVNKLWDSEAACMYLPANMKFQGASGHIVNMRWRTALWAFGESNITALKMSGLGRIR